MKKKRHKKLTVYIKLMQFLQKIQLSLLFFCFLASCIFSNGGKSAILKHILVENFLIQVLFSISWIPLIVRKKRSIVTPLMILHYNKYNVLFLFYKLQLAE